ncbi:centrosome-associated protein [Sesbania bispinosa]|nr:centrosome-associated protein [Sesbania bispinosa]
MTRMNNRIGEAAATISGWKTVAARQEKRGRGSAMWLRKGGRRRSYEEKGTEREKGFSKMEGERSECEEI